MDIQEQQELQSDILAEVDADENLDIFKDIDFTSDINKNNNLIYNTEDLIL